MISGQTSSRPEDVARAFELGVPVGGLVLVRRGDAEAWRLDTSTGSYFVKGYFEDLTGQLAVAMEFERLALEAGVDMPEPVAPADPLLGWVTRIDERLFRVYRWVEHRDPALDVSSWFGRTMAQVHQLQPLGSSGLPQWWRQAVHLPATWEGWLADAQQRQAPWVDSFAETLPRIRTAGARIAELCDDVPDLVTTHGDFKPHNIVNSPSGPVLVDWDAVRTDSAALEAGRAAYIFGAGDPQRIRRILTAYTAAGGELGWTGPDLFLSVTRNHLQVLGDLIQVWLGQADAARWMGDRAAIEGAIAERLLAMRAAAPPGS
ncbi:phosphotransferase [Kribbella sp. NPDC051936]|uniref:phosphotransferase n=1 Tax=Kribbella sp. NPDC051936 TaxID=3154946 RepID=UPI003415DB71